jgi:hypothetical protein
MHGTALQPVCSDGGLRSIPDLIELKSKCPQRAIFDRSMGALPVELTAMLIDRLSTTADPLLQWCLHLELDRRDVPPCLRGSRSDLPQDVFLTWLADVMWLANRMRGHKPLFTRWAGLFNKEPHTRSWHTTALWVYRGAHGRRGHYFARGLGLTEDQRHELQTMPTFKMQAERQLLRRLPEYHEQITAHALSHRDRSGVRTPTQIADRRTALLRLFLLAGRNQTKAAHYLELTTGEHITRQALSKQLDIITTATRLRKLK